MSRKRNPVPTIRFTVILPVKSYEEINLLSVTSKKTKTSLLIEAVELLKKNKENK